jgi:hypothetical protein
MAEYWISHIKKDKERISKVNAFLNTIEGLKNPNIFSKHEVIESIDDRNDEWYTCMLTDKNSGKRFWKKGSRIHIIEKDGKKYLRTNPDNIGEDNLGKLPSLEQINKNSFLNL